MDFDCDSWYTMHKVKIDEILEIIYRTLKHQISLPKFIPYNFKFEWEQMRVQMIEYLYYNS